jgi:hypothetical protein
VSMRKRSGAAPAAGDGLRWSQPRRRHLSVQSVIGGVALAAIVCAAAAAVYPHLGAEADAAIAPAERASFGDRFGALGGSSVVVMHRPAPETSPEIPDDVRRGYAKLFDVTASLGPGGDTFSTEPRAFYGRRLASLAPAGSEAIAPPDVAKPSSQLAKAVPLPLVRPSKLARLDNAPVAIPKTKPAPASSGADRIFEKLFGKPLSGLGTLLAYAPSDGGILSDGQSASPTGRYDRTTAVYDITAKKVYLPDGTKLEAHSGLGPKMDDPRFAHVKMHGVTPPHIYDLKMREALFHGVEAIRLHPVGGQQAIHNRVGLLAHPYLLGPRGDSNGCVSFKDYEVFLRAFKRGDIKRLAVVERVE